MQGSVSEEGIWAVKSGFFINFPTTSIYGSSTIVLVFNGSLICVQVQIISFFRKEFESKCIAEAKFSFSVLKLTLLCKISFYLVQKLRIIEELWAWFFMKFCLKMSAEPFAWETAENSASLNVVSRKNYSLRNPDTSVRKNCHFFLDNFKILEIL